MVVLLMIMMMSFSTGKVNSTRCTLPACTHAPVFIDRQNKSFCHDTKENALFLSTEEAKNAYVYSEKVANNSS